VFGSESCGGGGVNIRGGIRILSKNSNFCAKIRFFLHFEVGNRSENFLGLTLLPLFINQSTAKNFPIEIFLKLIDSSIKNLGEFEYDNQNWL
jgi:hypothetical protein